jgi:hypothetical protein
MNKKGMIFYWLLLAILLGVGISFMVNYDLEVGELKGVWQLSFIRATQEAEKDLLLIDNQALIVAKETNIQVSSNPFSEDLGCGTLGTLPLWNKKEQFCSLKLEEKFTQMFNQKMIEAGFLSYNLSIQDGQLIGKSEEKKTVGSENPNIIPTEKKSAGLFTSYDAYLTKPFYLKYTYNPSFRIPVHLSFSVYEEMERQAQQLVYLCQNELEIRPCLDQNKPSSWKYSSCTQEQFQEMDRKVPLCVEKEGNAALFGLDFSPQKTFSPKDAQVVFTTEEIKVTFNAVKEAEQYRVYYTNWPYSGEFPATVQQIFFATMGNYFYEKLSLTNTLIEDCPSEMEFNRVYLCGIQITYLFNDPKLVLGETYYFGITSTNSDQESLVYNLVKLDLSQSQP